MEDSRRLERLVVKLSADLTTFSKRTDAALEKTSADLKKTSADLTLYGKRTEVALRATAQLTLGRFNAYAIMTQTSAGVNKSKQVTLRTDYYTHCGITDSREEAVASEKAQAACMLTGLGLEEATASKKVQAVCVLTGRAGMLKLAHLLPASANTEIKRTLAIQDVDIWNFRNVLLLAWNIEHWYDRTKLSFVPHPLYEGCYVMKIWDDSIRNILIWEGAKVSTEANDNTIGYYENRLLNLVMKNGIRLDPFKRCLSYQNFICFTESRLRAKEAPKDFGSDLGDPEWTNVRDDFMTMRKSLEKDIESEAESEITSDP
jgi:HNH endonuclease